ncbi:hypothetical protein J6590_053030 [Homalodisca vitripennis]|nr:hypothetical protein J6590_053030 [Homalodisca vitripennis]
MAQAGGFRTQWLVHVKAGAGPHPLLMKLEALQLRFIRLVGVRLGYDYLEVPVDDITRDLHLPSLAWRREVADVLLLWKIVNGQVQCPDLLAEIDLRDPSAITLDLENFLVAGITPPTSTTIVIWQDLLDWVIELYVNAIFSRTVSIVYIAML